MTRALVTLVAGAWGCAGCLSSTSFGTARTVAPGEIAHQVGITAFVRPDDGGDATLYPFPIPSYGLRAGITEDVDVGARASLVGQLSMDAKWTALETSLVELAIGGAVWAAIYPTRSDGEESALMTGVELPLIAGLNVTRFLSLVAHGGPGYALVPASGVGGVVLRAGGGVAFRGDGFVIQPEVSTLIDTARGETIDVAAGVGLMLGAVP